MKVGNFATLRSAVLEKMTAKVAILGNFPEIPEVKNGHFRNLWAGGSDVLGMNTFVENRVTVLVLCMQLNNSRA